MQSNVLEIEFGQLKEIISLGDCTGLYRTSTGRLYVAHGNPPQKPRAVTIQEALKWFADNAPQVDTWQGEVADVIREALDQLDMKPKTELSSRSIEQGLRDYQALHGLGRKPLTRKCTAEILATIRKNLSGLDRPASALTTQEIITFGNKVDGFCPARWNAMLSVLRSITPAAAVLKRRALRFRDVKLPNEQEFRKLLEFLDNLDRRSKAGLHVRFIALSGLRFAEFKGLRWSDLGNDRITVPSGIAKSGKARTIPFLNGMDAIVEKMRSVSKSNDLVAPKPRFRRALERACNAIAIPLMSYHSLRHMFATRCIQKGIDLPTVARWMGHQDGGALLARMYFHLADERSQQVAAKLNIL